jgi:ubiquinone biosynthesis protein COQ9
MSTELKEKIIDAALELAEQRSWEAVRLHDVAAAIGLTLEDIRLYFGEKEELADAWFDRADKAMLRAAETPAFSALSTRGRLHRLIMAWLLALGGHRRVTRQMIFGKLEPGHLHILIPGVMRVSRTVQWMREAAQQDATYMRRALEETGLTTIYLMTFFVWMWDGSSGSTHTSEFLDRRLGQAEALSR